MFNLGCSLADHDSERKTWRTIEEWKESLMNHHVEPPVNKRMKRIGFKPWNDLDGSSWRDNAENLALQKRKDEAIETENWYDEPLRKAGINHLDEQK